MTEGASAATGERRVLYLAVTIAALLVAVYLALQVIGFLIRLALLAAVIVIAVAAYRAWKRSR